MGTHAAPRAALSREVGARAVGTHRATRAALRRKTGDGAQVTHGSPRATLSREAGTTPPPILLAHDMWHPQSCPEPGGGSRSRWNTWCPQRCPEPGGRSRSRGDMWHPQSCHAPGGRYHSTAPSSAPFRGWPRHGAIPIRPPLLLPRRHPTWVAAPSTTSTTTSTSATSASKGYNLHMVLTGFYSSHSICVSSSDSTFDLFSSLTICGAPAVTVGGC
jgi:hypothetical protein